MDLPELTLAVARDGLRRRDFSSCELTSAYLDRIQASGMLNVFSHTNPEATLAEARRADAQLADADAPDMCGIPVAIKDLFCVEGMPAQAASRILSGFCPAYESGVTERLRAAGAVLTGKVNMDEFAMGSSTEHSAFGPTVSPWRAADTDARLTPGGSSGGSAAAVAANLSLAALGTDTGGSIRQPAGFTGIVGLKPTYGRCSRWGIMAFASSLDQAGPLTKTVRDAAIVLHCIAGHDGRDSTSARHPVPAYESGLDAGIKGMTIGIPREYRIDGMPEDILAMWEDGAAMLGDAGARLVDVSLPHTRYALPAYYVIAPAEASSNLARYDGVRYGYRSPEGRDVLEMYKHTRAEGFGPEVKRRVLIGTYVLSQGFYEAYYRRAQRVRTLVRRDFETVFADGVDALLTPSTPSSAFAIGEMADEDPIKMYLNDVFTVTVNLAGLPGISVPVTLDDRKLPIGLQLIGQPWQEDRLLRIAFALETAAQFTSRPAEWWLDGAA
ncbi:MAG: Asp-tRNA(Asn)/Glu-tRNA(Gln) amidotransferase subunit GatA [Rhodobacteraceae bacterium]|nr:Asp-tRNA(Asn)/Glu-tRNA(Gln) amidotransferase subunit GatA [Paracoccaceae bacterium]